MVEDALTIRQETAEVATRAFALDVLLRLEKVLKILTHIVEIDETFMLLNYC